MKDLALAKLAASGLTWEDARAAGIEAWDAQRVAALGHPFEAVPALYLPYADGFFRVRYLRPPASLTALAKGKDLRYMQPPGTLPDVYFPPSQNWAQIRQDPSQAVLVTEGELKALKASKEGFPTLGLGGVWSFRALSHGVEWLPALDQIVWAKRRVYIVFDSDAMANDHVSLAASTLAEEFHRKGAHVYYVTLPQIPGIPKTGLDDFLVEAGDTALQELLLTAPPLGLTRVLWDLSQTYCYIEDPGLIIREADSFRVSPTAFMQHLEAPKRYMQGELKDGVVHYKPASAAAAWVKWPMRRRAARLCYKPGKERLWRDQFNIWPGWGCEPKKGDHAPWNQLLDHLFTGAEPEAQRWFTQWCAYPLQYPGVKLFSAAVIHGTTQGTGKSFLGVILGRIYGKNYTPIKQAHLHGNFNQWALAKQFILADDITGSNKRQDADLLKKLITQETLWINTKGVQEYEIEDCINYLFTSNQPDAFFLEDTDRRYFIHQVEVDPLPEEFYVEMDLWLASGGAAAVFAHLLSVDTSDFNPAAPAFKTAAKERMARDGQSDLASWVRALLATPEALLTNGEVQYAADMYTNRQLLQLYDPLQRTGTTANGLGRELSRAGVRQACQGRPLRVGDGTQDRYYIVRNTARWSTADAQECVAHILAARATPTKRYMK